MAVGLFVPQALGQRNRTMPSRTKRSRRRVSARGPKRGTRRRPTRALPPRPARRGPERRPGRRPVGGDLPPRAGAHSRGRAGLARPRLPPHRPKPVAAVEAERHRLTVLMVGWEFPPFHTGGLGVHSYEMSRELAELGHRVVFVTPFDRPYQSAPGVEFLSEPAIPGEPIGSGAYDLGDLEGEGFRHFMDRYNDWISRLGRVVRGVDVVHVHDWFGTVGAQALARRLRAPLVMTVHSTELDRSLGHPHKEIFEREWIGVQAADRIIAVSRHLADQLVREYGADRTRVRVVYNAVRDPGTLPVGERTGDIVLFLGRLTAMKGPDVFLRAAARIAPSFPEVRFALAGEGPEYEPLVRLAVELGIGSRVLFLGKVSDEERSALLRDAAVFVLPSVTEPFGIVALEAMAAGVPTILSKTSGVAEVVSSVFRVDFWDIDEFASRMAELLEYPPLRQEMGDRGRAEATEEGWRERARQTVQVYREAIEAGRTTR